MDLKERKIHTCGQVLSLSKGGVAYSDGTDIMRWENMPRTFRLRVCLLMGNYSKRQKYRPYGAFMLFIRYQPLRRKKVGRRTSREWPDDQFELHL